MPNADASALPPLPTAVVDTEVPLVQLALARSGDKDDHAGIGVIAGGPADLRPDPQGKAFAQMLLDTPVPLGGTAPPGAA